MRKSLLVLVFILTLGIFAFGQPPTELLERLQKIRLLESDRNDVKELLADFVVSDDGEHNQEFSMGDLSVLVSYASGECSEYDDISYWDDAEESWNVAEWKVTRIEVEPASAFRPESFGMDLKGFVKEQRYSERPDSPILHNKKMGIAYLIEDGKIDRIILFPRSGSEKKLCNNVAAKKFYNRESWFGDVKLEDRNGFVCIHNVASVTGLELSTLTINAASGRQIKITTTAVDPENDVLTYKYIVSAGQIRGQGANVEWDLTGVPPGTYTITAGVDEGAGVIGKTETRTVVVE